ncbi:FMN reductase [Streptomyces sp. 846.5]|nr:NADPH-dependent FMN reductase [Streptomyces sp. 846.5]TDU04448.1 FMN reductase [Streptomyces sp. 846.5]
MSTILSVSGSPFAVARTTRLLRHLDGQLVGHGHTVVPLDVCTLPADALMHADYAHPAMVRVAELFARADGVVIGTPVYKAAYTGVLKSLLDLLPQHALAGKTVLPLAVGGSTAHTLAIDYALRPVLSSMGAGHIVPGRFVLDQHVSVDRGGGVTVEPATEEKLIRVVTQFSDALSRSSRDTAPGGPSPNGQRQHAIY